MSSVRQKAGKGDRNKVSAAGLYTLTADINLACRILPDENHRKARGESVRLLQRCKFAIDLFAQRPGGGLAVEYPCPFSAFL